MTTVSQTPANVVADADGLKTVDGIAGATITAGMICKLSSAGTWAAVDADDAIYKTEQVGVALCGASVNQAVRIMQGGTLTVGGTVSAGTVYCAAADTAGGWAPVADISTGKYLTIVGVAISATKAQIGIIVTAVAKV